MLGTNLGACFWLSRAFLPGMVERRWGRIVITANSISPGPIRQDGQEDMDTADRAERLRVPLSRTGLPGEVAAAVALLCSEECGFFPVR